MNLIRQSGQRIQLKPLVYSFVQRFSSLPNPVSDKPLKSKYDAIIVGGGHNGLVSASYLAKTGLNVCVLERRHLLGGAAVTEEIVPGFKFSRASYLLSLMRPQIMTDLELKKHGLKIYLRDPNSFTPILGSDKSLTLGRDSTENLRQIAQFSTKDAESFVKYESMLESIVEAVDPLLDSRPIKLDAWMRGSFKTKMKDWPQMKNLISSGRKLDQHGEDFYNLMTAPASKVLDRWFESEPLKATLATDSVIGAMISPHSTGSGYVLLHHVMGELEGIKGAWGYVEGGMGAVSMAIACSAASRGAELFTDKPVQQIVSSGGKVQGVVLQDGTEIKADIVLSNATPKVTYLDLTDASSLPEDFVKDIKQIDYTSPVTKINVAVNALPNFTAIPNKSGNTPLPHHRTTIHINCEDTEIIHMGYIDAMQGNYSKKPVIEMTIPSSLDPTVAPPGGHVVQLFTQYTPYTLGGGQEWTEEKKKEYANVVFSDIEKYAPGFKNSIIGCDILTPRDIEREFGLTGGNIFHGAMSLDQLYFNRPTAAYSDHRSPISGLYLCGSGAHPGGGVMGAPGRLAAQCVLEDRKK